MKEEIKHAVMYMAFVIIATALIIAAFTLFIAMPDIFKWVAGYIGEFMTWLVFIFIVGTVIIFCVSE